MHTLLFHTPLPLPVLVPLPLIHLVTMHLIFFLLSYFPLLILPHFPIIKCLICSELGPSLPLCPLSLLR